jgi:hypothetical protein
LPFFLALLLLALLSPAEAFAAGCPAPEAKSRLRVDIEIESPKTDHSHSRDALKTFDISLASPYQQGSKIHVNGLMRGAITLESNSTMAWQGLSDGSNNCFWYDEVALVIKMNPTIYVANEIPKDTCLYREVLAHEYKHYSVDYGVAQDFQVLLQDELDRYVKQIGVAGPFTAAQKDRAQKQMGDGLEAKIRSLNERLKKERLKRQGNVDTLDEYERVARACPDQTGRKKR